MSTTVSPQMQRDVVLRTGRTLLLRPIRPDDREALMDFFKRLSPESVHSRFFDLCPPDLATKYALDFDVKRDFGLIAEIGGEIVGVAHYFAFKSQPKAAEVAFAVADDAQGTGVASKLLESLVDAARESGIERFEAEALTENRAMIEVFRSTGFNVKSHSTEDTVHLSFPIAPTVASDDRSAERGDNRRTEVLKLPAGAASEKNATGSRESVCCPNSALQGSARTAARRASCAASGGVAPSSPTNSPAPVDSVPAVSNARKGVRSGISRKTSREGQRLIRRGAPTTQPATASRLPAMMARRRQGRGVSVTTPRAAALGRW